MMNGVVLWAIPRFHRPVWPVRQKIISNLPGLTLLGAAHRPVPTDDPLKSIADVVGETLRAQPVCNLCAKSLMYQFMKDCMSFARRQFIKIHDEVPNVWSKVRLFLGVLSGTRQNYDKTASDPYSTLIQITIFFKGYWSRGSIPAIEALRKKMFRLEHEIAITSLFGRLGIIDE